jgi:hypothetical protein
MKVTGRFDDGEFVCVWNVAKDRWAVKVLVHPKDYPWIDVSEFVVMSAWTRRKRFTKDHVLYQRLRVQAIEALDETWIDWKKRGRSILPPLKYHQQFDEPMR